MNKWKLGPGTYKGAGEAKDFTMNKSGKYRGLAKSTVEQLLMIDDVKAQTAGRPRPGHYKPVYVSYFRTTSSSNFLSSSDSRRQASTYTQP